MSYVKIEVIQNDGITVKERIIRFFQRELPREEAEALYDFAEDNGKLGGVKRFDESIEIVCEGLGLDSNELALEINKHNSSLS